MLQRHLDNRSTPVWSKVIPQSRGSHQQPAALSTFSRRRVVPLSGELVCSFKSVQCSTSFSKIGHLISLVAFQLQRLHFNCTSCTSSGSRFLQDGYKGAGHDHISLKMIELFWLRSHLAVLVGLRTMKTNTNQNRNKYIYKQIQIQIQIFSRPVLLWLRSHSVVGPRDNPGPVSAALDLPDPLYITWGKNFQNWEIPDL